MEHSIESHGLSGIRVHAFRQPGHLGVEELEEPLTKLFAPPPTCLDGPSAFGIVEKRPKEVLQGDVLVATTHCFSESVSQRSLQLFRDQRCRQARFSFRSKFSSNFRSIRAA